MRESLVSHRLETCEEHSLIRLLIKIFSGGWMKASKVIQ
nr:MAG TPA: hypothetical protein [Caudoviricetes sp.]